MNFDLNKSLEILETTPFVLEKQLAGLSKEWLMSNEGQGSWTPAEIVCHLIHCEKEDWIARMKIILSNSKERKFEPFNRTEGFEKSNTHTIAELVNEFKSLRVNNLNYLQSLKLTEDDLNKTGIHPGFGEVTLKQLISTWVVHDLSHIAQINRIMAKQYSGEVGPWSQYLPILGIANPAEKKTEGKKFDWNEYYKSKSNQTPRDTLLKALELFDKEKRTDEQLFAIDIGSGHGTDTLHLLKNNWRVLAIDNDANGLQILTDSVLPSFKRNVRTLKQPFEEMKLINCNFLNASYCLPFCKPEYFKTLWNEIENSVMIDGRFAGNFFGLKDSWADNKEMTFHTEEEVRNLFRNFHIEIFEERDEDGVTSIGEAKHWHVYSVIAKKN